MKESSTRAEPHRLASALNRYATIINLVSVALIAGSVLLIVRALPIEAALLAAESWIRAMGFLGPLVFGLIYVVAVVLMVPGSALTLAAGALFGLLVGTLVASLASTIGAALAFLVARHLARDAIARRLERSPNFKAIDKAISQSGWRIVALLRLSPAVPFVLQNYLYGLTGIRFLTYVLTSWVAMLPGTFLYVYLGHVGRAGLEAAAGGERSRSPAEWALIFIGLIATIAVTVYVAWLARGAIKEHTQITVADEVNSEERSERAQWPWGVTITAGVAILTICGAAFVQLHADAIARRISMRIVRPRVTRNSAIERSAYDAASGRSICGDLRTRVDGWRLTRNVTHIKSFLELQTEEPFNALGRGRNLTAWSLNPKEISS